MRKSLMLSVPLFLPLLLNCFLAKSQDFPVYQPLPPVKRPVVVRPNPNNIRIENNTYIQNSTSKAPQKTEFEINEEIKNRRLDEKNGFKNLELGADILSIMKIATITPIERISYPSIKSYKLWNITNYDVLDQPIKALTLEFKQDKLISILIELTDYNPKTDLPMRNAIMTEISNEYGSWSTLKLTTANIKDSVRLSAIIVGESVGLVACRYEYNTSKGDNQLSLGDSLRFFNEEYAGYILSPSSSGL